jgi:metallo-beta-lactamase class B
MALNSTSRISPPPEALMEQCCRRPWETYIHPFRMAPGVYYVSGNNWVACYLIDTGDGLILIDTAMHETAYLLIENVRKLGYEITDIKRILLTHAHIDHIGAARTLKELTGAKIYLGERDMLFLTERRDLIGGDGQYTCGMFEPDEFYADDKLITQGNIAIRTIATPGHTPGCTSMFFDVKDKDGKVLRCGIHGGIGLNTISKQYFEKTGLPISLRDEYIEGLKKLAKLHVDITLPSHTNQVGILMHVDKIADDYNPFIDPSIWHELMQERLERALELIEKEKKEEQV